jgi:hypothetical protein
LTRNKIPDSQSILIEIDARHIIFQSSENLALRASSKCMRLGMDCQLVSFNLATNNCPDLFIDCFGKQAQWESATKRDDSIEELRIYSSGFDRLQIGSLTTNVMRKQRRIDTLTFDCHNMGIATVIWV